MTNDNSNYNYQSNVKSHKRLQDIAVGDKVLIRVHPESFSLKILKKLHTRRRGPYKVLKRFVSTAYELDIPHDLSIILVFFVENLTHCRTSTRLQQFSVRPLQASLLKRPTTEEFVQSFSFRFYHPCRRHSLVNFSKPERIDENH